MSRQYCTCFPVQAEKLNLNPPPRCSVATNAIRNLDRDLLRTEELVIGALQMHQICSPGQCIVAFTCGHGFRREVFTSSIMPQLEQRMRALSPPVDKTLPMVLSEFGRVLATPDHGQATPKPCQLPCPVCFLKQLQKLPVHEHMGMRMSSSDSDSNSSTLTSPPL